MAENKGENTGGERARRKTKTTGGLSPTVDGLSTTEGGLPPTAGGLSSAARGLSVGADKKRRGRRGEAAIVLALRACGLLSVVGLLLIIVFVFREAAPVLFNREVMKEASLSKFFGSLVWQPVSDHPRYGLASLLLGTFKTTLTAMLIALPLGILAAVFASEFATPRLREVIKPAIELLAGIPSVVLGFFALVVMASAVQAIVHHGTRLNAFNAGLALALAAVPTIFTVSEDALRAVPRSYREASLALGASRWQTAWHVTLPAAGAGVSAAALLGLARAVGETMIVLMASGNAALISPSLFDSARSLSATIAAEMAEVVVGSPHYATLFFLGAILFGVTF
jgi:phosphate transport system permease protein